MHWTIAVDAHGSSAVAGPVVAAAMVYAGAPPPPVYRYDGFAGPCIGGIEAYSLMPAPAQAGVLRDLQRRSEMWALMSKYPAGDVAKTTRHTMGLAVARALERFFHADENLRDLGARNFSIQLPNTTPIPAKYTSQIRQLGLSSGRRDWRCMAALQVAQHHRTSAMLRIAQVFPEYEFDLNGGTLTPAHAAALKRFGPSPVHHTRGTP